MLIVYFLQQDAMIIDANISIVKILVNSIPPKPDEPRKYLTIITLEKLISNELLLNLIPASTAQKIHAEISINIKQTKRP